MVLQRFPAQGKAFQRHTSDVSKYPGLAPSRRLTSKSEREREPRSDRNAGPGGYNTIPFACNPEPGQKSKHPISGFLCGEGIDLSSHATTCTSPQLKIVMRGDQGAYECLAQDASARASAPLW